jgi:hypothetical protein
MFLNGFQRFVEKTARNFVTQNGASKLNITFTHVTKRGNQIVEIGAKNGRNIIWRKTATEAIALCRAGLGLIATPKDGNALEVVVEPGTLQTEARLRTVADKAFDRKLLSLPELD